MVVHDWSRVDDGLFHDFHCGWIIHLKEALNAGGLPPGYYARVEQHIGKLVIPDILTLQSSRPSTSGQPPAGTVAVSLANPPTRVARRLQPGPATRRRTIAIRLASADDQLVAVVELVSAANKDRAEHVERFVGKVGSLLRAGVHVVVLDLLPPTPHTPGGLHQTVADDFLLPQDDEVIQPADAPVALLSYEADMPDIGVFIEYLRVGDPIPAIPLFLAPGHYVPLPLGPTYEQAFRGLSRIDRDRVAPP